MHKVQQAIDSPGSNSLLRSPSQPTPTLGMRGGLGKTLLIAFLLLAIVPLSSLALLMNNQIQRDTGQKILISLETIVALKEAHIVDWVASYERELALLTKASDPLGSEEGLATDLPARLAAIQSSDPAWLALILVDRGTGEVIASTDPDVTAFQAWRKPMGDGRRLAIASASALENPPGGGPLLAVGHTGAGWQLIGLLRGDEFLQIISDSGDPDAEGGVTTSLITGDGLMISSQGLTQLFHRQQAGGAETLPQDIVQALQGQSGSGSYTDADGVGVFSAYRWNPELQAALLAKQPQAQALATGTALTAMVVGATLAVALITAAIAAIVTRRVTRPIVQLTETAAWMARGDLNQQVAITRTDEVGVLARAFNRMATELRTLYTNLEAKVAERTQQLEMANRRTSYHVMQLTISAEVARIISSIRDLDALLSTVVELIGNAFQLHHASIYLLDDSGESVVWQAGSNKNGPAPTGRREAVGGLSLVGQVAADGHRQVVRVATQDHPHDPRLVAAATSIHPPVQSEMVIPVQVRGRVLGVLDLRSSRLNDFDDNDQMVYQSLADQIGIAIENARAYAVERETVEKLRELDRIQSQFLTNMSHALRTPLNSIIGFSRVMLKELDGPLSDLQRTDLTAIHESGRQLLGLINDMLELSQLDLGTVPFSISEVDLAEIIEGVMATARALARGKPIQLHEEILPDLPTLQTDGQRVRQVILALLCNAIKFTDEGSIRLRVISDNGCVTISVSDTGMGIPPSERALVFSDALYSEADSYGGERTPGFGLAISKRVVEKLGGQIWVESKEGAGSTFTFTLPIKPAGSEPT